MFLRQKERKLSFEEIRKRAKILVIDDNEFVYKQLFEKDGYSIEKWDDIINLQKLEDRYYDIILLDIQGVGRDQSIEQGLGILKHVKQVNPTQIIIAYSNADWSLRYQEFFNKADLVLAKNADYVEFKRSVDKLLEKVFSINFYIEKILYLIGPENEAPKNLIKIAEKAIKSGKTKNLEKLLKKTEDTGNIIEGILKIVKVGIKIFSLI